MDTSYNTGSNQPEKKPSKWRITFNAPVTLVFAAICIIALILNFVTFQWSNKIFFMAQHTPLKNPLTWLRLFTHVFGHSGFAHLIGNLSYILLLGPLLEEKYGSKFLLAVMAITAFATGLTYYIFFPHTSLLGASGVVFAFILLSSITNIKDGEIPVTFILVAVIYIGMQVFEGVKGMITHDNVANLAHIIGGLVGAGCGFVLPKKKA